MPNAIKDILWKLWYPLLTRLTRKSQLTFLNYGYAPENPADAPILAPQDEPDRPCAQLYHRVAGAVDLRDRDVLEVSCGHGGGASFIARSMSPRMLHALDRNGRAIALCRRTHTAPNLTFIQGNALELPFPADTFDAVLNVEASHCYPDFPRFLAEVHRVLRPAGDFLFTDFRDAGAALARLDQQLAAAGFTTITREDITANVLGGMRDNTPRYSQLIKSIIPRPFRIPAQNFAGTNGSAIYKQFASGTAVYVRYHLKKPA